MARIGDIEFGLQANVRATEVGPLADDAERMGFARFLVPDHPGTSEDPFVALAAAAMATKTIGLGTYVLNAGVRDPWQVATAAATLNDLSRGRLTLGLGAGHTPTEWALAGSERPDALQRVRRLEEFVAVVTALLEGGPVVFEGEHFRLEGACLARQRVEQEPIPLVIGGNGPRLLELAGRCADVVSVTGLGRTREDGHTHETRWSLADVDRRMKEISKGAAGRSTSPRIEILVQHLELTDDPAQAAGRFIRDAPELSLDIALDTPFVHFGTPAAIADSLRRWQRRLGVASWVVRPSAMRAAAAVADVVGGPGRARDDDA